MLSRTRAAPAVCVLLLRLAWVLAAVGSSSSCVPSRVVYQEVTPPAYQLLHPLLEPDNGASCNRGATALATWLTEVSLLP